MPVSTSRAGHAVVSRDAWVEARKTHLEHEKEFTRQRDELSRERRQLPWLEINQDYSFEGPEGMRSLGELFGGRSQLIVYHFMLGPDWDEGCVSCSFWADNFNGVDVHLAHRDATFVVVSRAPLQKIESYKRRMDWSFAWLSSSESTFNLDMGVSHSPDDVGEDELNYNFGTQRFGGDEAPGVSVFLRDDDGRIFLTYQTFARGLDMVNGAYHFLDLTPNGRDEDELPWTMAWLSRHDAYGD
jgi:predicted dithiol-disulfide oxidoreductase (DUF899 family)